MVHVHSWTAAGASHLQTPGNGCLLFVGFGTLRMPSSVPFMGEQSLSAFKEGPDLNYKFFRERQPTEYLDPDSYNERG